MGILIEILLGTGEFILSFLSPLLIWTGEIFLWIVTVGCRKPTFKIQGDPLKVYLLPINYFSFWIGLALWLGFAFWLKYMFSWEN